MKMDLLKIIKENRVDGKCNLTDEGLSKKLSISISTIKRVLKGLVDKGVISIEGGGETRKITISTKEKTNMEILEDDKDRERTNEFMEELERRKKRSLRKRLLREHINNKINEQSDFINNSLVTMLIKYSDYLVSHSSEGEITYIDNLFKGVDITSTKIETEFTNIILELEIDIVDYDILENYKNVNGIYKIYNVYDICIYIGKTTNCSERPLVSFTNKLPNGAKYLEVLPYPECNDDTLHIIETVFIDYHTPMFNTAQQVVRGVSYKSYTNLINRAKENKEHMVYPTNNYGR